MPYRCHLLRTKKQIHDIVTEIKEPLKFRNIICLSKNK